MDAIRDYAMYAAITGVSATAVIDLWAIARRRLLGTPLPNYALVGRWIAHYAIGIMFAALLLAIWGLDWLRHPSLAPALAVGIATVTAPFLLMQPGMGAGIAASRTPRPAAARIQSLVTHAVFGLGLYAAGCVINLVLND